MDFLRSNLQVLVIWPAVALAAALIGWTALLTDLSNDRQQAEANALKEAEILSRAYARHLDHALEAIDQITLYVKHGWESAGSAFRLEEFSGSGLFSAQSGILVSLIDQDGNLITSTIPEVQPANIVDEPFFKVHVQHADQFHIGTARIGRFSRTPVVPFSRRLADSSGRFRGIVLVSVDPGYFMSGYDEVALRENGFLGILGSDSNVRLARIGQRVFLPHADSQALTAQPSFSSSAGSALFDGRRWFIDQRSRFTAWHATDQYRMIVLAGLGRDDMLATYWTKHRLAVRNAALASTALAMLAAVCMAVSLRLSWRARQVEAMQATYRTATEGGNEGFFIASPVEDAQGRTADFRITDCNERGAQFLGFRRGELIGKRVLEIYSGEAADRALRMLFKAMKARTYEGEADLSGLDVESPGWVHFRITRPDRDLAVTMRDITALKSHVAALEKRGNEDALTGLMNRHWVNGYLPKAIEQAAIDENRLALLFIDLDGFKAVNDTMGHEAGDEILRHAGQRLKEATRPNDHVVRIGGDEFLVILEKSRHPSDAAHVAERILQAFSPAFKVPQGIRTIGVSIGISVFPNDGTDANSLLNNADVAMYSVKTAGKGSYRFFDAQFLEILRARHQREADLRHALEHDQLVMYYQPRVEVSTGITSSMEALVRWAHPTRGMLGPDEFIALAEETGLIVRLGTQVIDKVCAQLASWAQRGQQMVPVSINVSAHQFREANFAAQISACLFRYRIDPGLLEIELTESCMIDSGDEVTHTLHALQKLGIKLLVDDFGTGYSSLSQLQRMDFDVLKVDRAFTAELERSREGVVLFSAIITMAHALGMRVVAEGVETIGQIRLLKSLRCDEVQGYFISTPLPPSDTQPILPRWFFPSTA